MCIIIHKPQGKTISKEVYEECFRCNKDGAGFSYVDNNLLVIDKGYFQFNLLYEKILPLQDREMLIHFRIATHGEIGAQNCHPFSARSRDGRFVFSIVHNGVLSWRSTKEMSDTACFIEDIFGRHLSRDPWFLDEETGMHFLEKSIGVSNKMAVMRLDLSNGETKTYIANKSAGNEDAGCWFSNFSWKIWPKSNQDFDGYYGENYEPAGDKANRHVFNGHSISPTEYGFVLDRVTGKYVRLKDLVEMIDARNRDKPSGNENHHPKSGPISALALRRKEFDASAEKNNIPEKSIIADCPSVSLEGGISIEVPRDVDQRPFFPLLHLSKPDRKILRRMAADYIRSQQVDIKGFSNGEMIQWLREDVREWLGNEEIMSMSDEDLDKWIVYNKKNPKESNLLQLWEQSIIKHTKPEQVEG